MKDRAAVSIQAAIRKWNNAARWKIMRTRVQIAVVAGTATYALPWDFKDWYTGRLSTAKRPIFLANRRQYDRYVWDQTQTGTPIAATLAYEGTQGKLELLDTPNANDTLVLWYYRRMAVPCITTITHVIKDAENIFPTAVGTPIGGGVEIGNQAYFSGSARGIVQSAVKTLLVVSPTNLGDHTDVSLTIGSDDDFLDIPVDWEEGILSYATWHFLTSVGGPVEKIQMFFSEAEESLRLAKKDNNTADDFDLAFDPQPNHGAAAWNPNSIYRYGN